MKVLPANKGFESYFGPETRHPAIPALGRSIQHHSRPAFGLHTHTCWEICLVTEGSIEYETEGRRYTLPPNSIQISQPEQVHGTPEELLHPCALSWFHLDPTPFSDPSWRRLLLGLPLSLPQGAHELMPGWERLLQECRQPRRDSRLAVEAALFSFLVDLGRLAQQEGNVPTLPERLARALEWLDQVEAEEEITVRAWADGIGLHRAHLHELCVNHLGVFPQRYLMERRLQRAANRLTEKTASITDIAYELAFSSTQHFATAFKARYGCSPSAFRRQKLLSGPES